MNLYSDTFDFEKFYLETKDDDMYCIVFNLIEDIQCLKEELAKHDVEVFNRVLPSRLNRDQAELFCQISCRVLCERDCDCNPEIQDAWAELSNMLRKKAQEIDK